MLLKQGLAVDEGQYGVALVHGLEHGFIDLRSSDAPAIDRNATGAIRPETRGGSNTTAHGGPFQKFTPTGVVQRIKVDAASVGIDDVRPRVALSWGSILNVFAHREAPLLRDYFSSRAPSRHISIDEYQGNTK